MSAIQLRRSLAPIVFHEDDPDGERRNQFGFEAVLLQRRAEQWIRASDPNLDDSSVYFAASKAYMAYVSRYPSYAEISAEICRTQPAASSLSLTPDEWRYLAEALEGVNNPIGRSVLDKALRFVTCDITAP